MRALSTGMEPEEYDGREDDMIKKLMFLGVGAAGYVLGAKAGRERYEQIAEQAKKLRNNPTVQEKMGQAKTAAKDAAGTAVDKAREHSPVGSSSGVTCTSTTNTSTPTVATDTSSFGVGSEDT